jgi:hypothetical protein
MKVHGFIFKASMGVLFAASTLLSSPASSASVQAPQYPQPVLAPAVAAADDSISLWLILGQYADSCSIPYYSTGFSIKVNHVVCIMGPCPPEQLVTLVYYPIYWDYSGIGYCPQSPTEYGPKFSFGNLAPGYYTVMDSMTGKWVTSFTVGPPKKSFRVSGVVSEDMGILDAFKAVAKCKVYLRDNTLTPVVPCTTCVDTLVNLAKA